MWSENQTNAICNLFMSFGIPSDANKAFFQPGVFFIIITIVTPGLSLSTSLILLLIV